MSEMVERVATAIQRTFKERGALQPSMQEARVMARAAIEAMREPTEEMVDAGFPAINNYPAPYNQMKFGYQAMIDAALQPEQEKR